MDETRCARIVWTITKDFSAETGSNQALVLLRNSLAEAIFATEGRGFPEPVEVDSSDLETAAWKGCVKAAVKAKSAFPTAPPAPQYLLLWPKGDTDRPAETVPLKWPRKETKTPAPTAIGPVLDGSNSEVWLFAYDTIDTEVALSEDGDAGPGLFPRQPGAGALSHGMIGKVSSGWAWLLFIAALALSVFTMIWVYGAAELVHGAADKLVRGVSFAQPAGGGEQPYVFQRESHTVDELLGDKQSELKTTQRELAKQEGALKETKKQLEQVSRDIGQRADSPPTPLAEPGPPPSNATEAEGNALPNLAGATGTDQAAKSLQELKQAQETLTKDAERLQEQVKNLNARMEEQSAENLVLKCLVRLQARMNSPQGALETRSCNEALRKEWQRSREDIAQSADTWAGWLDWLWRASDVRGEISLLLPLATSALAILLLILSAGLALKSTPAGAIIDERNRISLSRLQQLCWTVVLFGGFTILGIFNISLLADFARDLGQMQALVDVTRSGQQGSEFYGLFPSMDPTLWAVLGVTVAVSPYLSKRILSGKDLPQGAQTDSRTLQVRTDPLDRRDALGDSRWADLFTGEGKANASHVDVSRLQHLIITTLLLGGYIVLLIEYVRTLDATAILMAIMTGVPVFASMPPVDATFVGLLALSHAGYLVFKAMPSAPAKS